MKLDSKFRQFLLNKGIIQQFSTIVPLTKREFITRLKNHVDQGDLGFFSDSFDVFSSSKNDYKGTISDHSFQIKRRKRFFDLNRNFAVAKGTFYNKEDQLLIETEVNGFPQYLMPFLVLFFLFYFIGAIFIVITAFSTQEFGMLIGLLFLVLHASLFVSIFYFIGKRSASQLQKELDREFVYLARYK